MKKLLLPFFACAAMGGFAADDPLADYTKYYWNKPDGGNWNTAANWVMADGTTATDYPKAATDAAIFNGTNPKANVTIPAKSTNEVGVVYFESGMTSFKFASSTGIRLHINRLLREDHATMSFATDGWNWTDPGECVIDNRDEILVDECIPGATWRKDDGDWAQLRSVTVLEDDALLKHANDDAAQSYNVEKTTTWENHYSLAFGNWGDGRNISFSGDYVLTVPSGQILPFSKSHVGTVGGYQGTIATSGGPVYFYPRSDPWNNFRSLIKAPAFVLSSPYATLFYDDHSAETNLYYVTQGKLVLGDGAATDLTATCKLGTGDVYVGWSGTLDVQCVGALANVGAIRMASYRGQGSTWGKISMSVSDTVTKAYVDGISLERGTYGATGSDAQFIDDTRFSGSGVLTVLKDDIQRGLRLFLR